MLFAQVTLTYSGQIFALFILCKEAKKISKSLQKKAKQLRKKKNENSNCFYVRIKGSYHIYQFLEVNQKYIRSKTPAQWASPVIIKIEN